MRSKSTDDAIRPTQLSRSTDPKSIACALGRRVILDNFGFAFEIAASDLPERVLASSSDWESV